MAAILPQAPGLTTGELRTRLAKLVIQADPDAAVKRHKARKKQRRVELHNTEDSCATLLGLNLPADDALAASNRLSEFARALKQAGDPRSMVRHVRARDRTCRAPGCRRIGIYADVDHTIAVEHAGARCRATSGCCAGITTEQSTKAGGSSSKSDPASSSGAAH